MIVRGVLRFSARGARASVPRIIRHKVRRYSTSAPASVDSASPASMIGAFTNELDKIAPRFEVRGSQINVIRTPTEFYETLKVGISAVINGLGLIVADQNPGSGGSNLPVHFVYRQN
jgi:CDP-diacylglycerol--glycerol-3-phosphate 3-phosphatidyltransferase